MSDYLDPNNEELLKDFFAEAEGQVEIIEQNVLVLEQDPGNKDAIDELFRAAHTLKGGSATVEMSELAGFTHTLEDVLDSIRSGKTNAGSETADLLLKALDIIKLMLEYRSNGEVYEADISGVLEGLAALVKGKAGKKAAAPPKTNSGASKKVSLEADSSASLSEYEILELKEAARNLKNIFKVEVFFDENNPMNTVGGIQIFAALKDVGQVLKTNPDFEQLYEDNFYPIVTYYVGSDNSAEVISKRARIADVVIDAKVSQIENASSDRQPAKDAKSDSGMSSKVDIPESEDEVVGEMESEESDINAEVSMAEIDEKSKNPKKAIVTGSLLRVDSKRIDNLLNLVSETVINKATFNQLSARIAGNLQGFQNLEAVMKEKMHNILETLPEMVKVLSENNSNKDFRNLLASRLAEVQGLYAGFENELKTSVSVFKNTVQNLGRITSELQEGVMRIRMVPISQIFSRFPRLVRDLSKNLSKKIGLQIEGEDTELDKSVVEDLLDPIMHCVRNSIDHGIENTNERLKTGKPEEGKLLLKASNEGNMILIEVSDDGRGIDVERIRKKAIERKLIHPDKHLTEVEAYNLIFEAGFSTADKVTSISGRGVGLDVVRRQIEKLNGSVSVVSELGKGSRFLIKLPLTLAIIQGLLVKVGKEVYAIPITSVIESHRIKPSEISFIDNYEVFNVRNEVCSLLRLDRLFRIKSEEKRDYLFVVIVGSADKKMGLVVDSLIGEEDVVIKPLKDKYATSPGIAGATIRGDGTVSLIIDVSQLLELGLRKEKEERRQREIQFNW